MLLLLVVSGYCAMGQGLVEQNKFYGSVTTSDYTALQLDAESKMLEQPINISANDYLVEKIVAELNSLKDIVVKNKQNQDGIIIKRNEEIAKLKIKIKGMYELKFDNNLSQFEIKQKGANDEYMKHIGNLKKLKEKPDSLKNFELQWYKDSCTYIYIDKLYSFKACNDSLKNVIKYFKTELKKLDTLNYDEQSKKIEKIANEIQEYINDIVASKAKSINDFLDAFNKTIKAKIDKLNGEVSDENLSTLPGFTSLLNNPEFTPVVELLAGSSFKHKNEKLHINGVIRLFAGTTGKKNDSVLIEQRKKLFIPTTSNWGIVSNFTFGTIDDKKKEYKHLGLVLGLGFTGKTISRDTLQNFNSVFFNFKIGAEWAFFKNLSVYGGFNTVSFLSNIDILNDYFGADRNKTYTYFDIGARTYLDLGGKSGFSLLTDINCIFTTPKIREYVFPFNDPAILNIQFGVRKTLK